MIQEIGFTGWHTPWQERPDKGWSTPAERTGTPVLTVDNTCTARKSKFRRERAAT
jgi:hypothetical protein